MKLSYEELISREPIKLNNIGYLKIPQLSEIWTLGYKIYEMYCNYLAIDLNKFLEITNLKEQYEKLDYDGKQYNSLFNLILNNKEFRDMYQKILSFFMVENVFVDNENERFVLWIENNDKSKNITGIVDNSNFDYVRHCLIQCSFLKEHTEEEPVKYKNEMAKKWAEKINKSIKTKEEKNTLTLGKMISKYCTDNKNGINMLNVFELTIYQFYDQWMQHNHIKQCDIQDMIYANTVNFNDLKQYNSQMWLE